MTRIDQVTAGYQLRRGLVPRAVCDRARRRLLLELRRCGVTPQEVADWSTSTWWPSLREEPELHRVRDFLPSAPVWAETQILIRLPDEDDTRAGGPHLDDLPRWATLRGLRYRTIYGVELTDTPPDGGSTRLFPGGPAGADVVQPLRVGDVLEMSPGLWHSGSPNLSGDVRIALFFRALEPTP